MSILIKVSKIDKHFENVHALKAVSMCIRRGSIYGLVGTNGSGKTTILKHITGIIRPDSGSITLDGRAIYENTAAKQRICFVPDDLFFFGNYNLNDMRRLYAGMYQKWNGQRFDALVNAFGLDRSKKIIRFSKGMQKQAAFTLAISAMPDALILDEPVDGLDPIVRRTVWDIIVNDVAEREMTVLISSHNLKEIEGICDTVGILSAGELVLERELDDLKSNIHKVQVAFAKPQPDVYSALNILSRNTSGSVDMLIVRNSAEDIEDALNPYSPLILDMLPLTLEEIFIYELGGEKNEYSSILL